MDLSIIIPCYNTEIQILKECLLSIENADIQCNYEIIIINDGSTDEALNQFLNNYQKDNVRIIVKEHSGVSASRNLGLKASKGKYILLLDSDDILLSNINEAIRFLVNNPEYDLVYSDTEYFGTSEYYYRKGHFSLFKLLYMFNFLNISTLFTREITEKYSFDESLHYAEDYDFWCKIALGGYQFKYLPAPIFKYRRVLNGQSLSQINEQNKQLTVNNVKSKHQKKYILKTEDINEFIINNFKDDKKQIFKLVLMVLFPRCYKYLKNIRIFNNNSIIS